jgi:hypothetical protein
MYFASQAPNEGRYPRLRVIVPSRDATNQPDVPLRLPLTVNLIQRLGPALDFRRQALVVRNRDAGLETLGIVIVGGPLTELSLTDPFFSPLDQPQGLRVEISAPGEVRAGEHWTHRLHAGQIHQEKSFVWDDWFGEWCQDVGVKLLGLPSAGAQTVYDWNIVPRFAVAAVWLRVLNQAAGLRHGACYALLSQPETAPIRPVFGSSGCDLGAALVACRDSSAIADEEMPWMRSYTAEHVRHRVVSKQRLLTTVEALANLTATDGCVVLNRRLQLHSFGSMIEPTGSGSLHVPAFFGDSSVGLDESAVQSFGARRRSALALCRACPDSLVFVISQDGDLRAFVHRLGAVRLYDHLAYW